MSKRKETIVLPPGFEALAARSLKLSKPARVQLSAEHVAESDQESESEEVSSSSSEESSTRESGGGSRALSANKPNQKATQTSVLVPGSTQNRRSSFKPPLGFQALSTSAHAASQASTWVSESQLAGKQIWHFQIPSAIPITSVSQITLDAIASGGPITTHEGVYYGFLEEQDMVSRTKLMLFSEPDGVYRPVSMDITKTLRLQRTKRSLDILYENSLPLPGGSQSALADHTYARKAVRQQPKGLKMRFLPAGFRETDLAQSGSSSSSSPSRASSNIEMTDVDFRSHFKVPEGFPESAPVDKPHHIKAERARESPHQAASDQLVSREERQKKPKYDHSRVEKRDSTVEPRVPNGVHKPPKEPKKAKGHRIHGQDHHKDPKVMRDDKGRRRETSLERRRRKKQERRLRGKHRDEDNMDGVEVEPVV